MPTLKFFQTVISRKYKQCKLEQQWVQNQKSAFSHGPPHERLWEKKVLKTPTHQNDWTLTTVEIMMLGPNFQNSPLCLMQVVWGVLAHIFSTRLAFTFKCFHRPTDAQKHWCTTIHHPANQNPFTQDYFCFF